MPCRLLLLAPQLLMLHDGLPILIELCAIASDVLRAYQDVPKTALLAALVAQCSLLVSIGRGTCMPES